MTRTLDVYLHSIKAGHLFQGSNGSLTFTYDPIYLQEQRPALSISLPLREESYEGNYVKALFSGYLPDDLVRKRLARFLGLSEKNSFALLEVVGGECAGAISLHSPGQAPVAYSDTRTLEVLDDYRLSEILNLVKSRPLLVGVSDLRLSLAGAQDKIAVGLSPEGRVALVHGGQPTTHILKPLISNIADSVHNELFCMRLAKAIGIKAPAVSIGWVGTHPYFLVERYDRYVDALGQYHRLHQEDFCQSLGCLPDMKYEKEGGPTIQMCQQLIADVSGHPALDHMAFLSMLIFNYFIGNNDAHGKNFSWLYVEKVPVLAPAYDLLSTSIYPHLSKSMAMKISGSYDPDGISVRHWMTLVPDKLQAQRNLEKTLIKMARSIRKEAELLEQKLNKESLPSPVYKSIRDVIAHRTAEFV